MPTILACIDGSIYAPSVAEHAAWAAGKLGATVDLMQVLGRREASSQDRSGRIAAGARRRLLEELAALDAERAKLLHQQGWLDLEEARTRVEAGGVRDVTTALRHGDLLETLGEREPEIDLLIVGKRGEAADFATGHLGSNLERMLRAAHKPVLVASRQFRPVETMLIAFDGRPAALKAVDDASRSPLFKGVTARLVMVGDDNAAARATLEAAADQLRAGGLAATAEVAAGSPNTAIPEIIERDQIPLLVMGAYGHSRLRTMMIGSTTSEMIRRARASILVYR